MARRSRDVMPVSLRQRERAPTGAPLETIDAACKELEQVAGSSAGDFSTAAGAYPAEVLRLVGLIRSARAEIIAAAVDAVACNAGVPPELLPRPLAWVRTS